MRTPHPTGHRRPGLLFAIEGPDGIGKSQLMEPLQRLLAARWPRPVTALREPGGTATGEALRGFLLDPARAEPVEGGASALLFSAARAALFVERVRPALDRGETVLLDRFVPSTYVYQGGEQGVAAADLETLTRLAVGDDWPDVIAVLTLDEAEAARRRAGRGPGAGASDAFDRGQSAERQRRYIDVAAQLPNTVLVEMGDTPEESAQRIARAFEARLASRGPVAERAGDMLRRGGR